MSVSVCNSHMKRTAMHNSEQLNGLLSVFVSYGKAIFRKPHESFIESLNAYIALCIYSMYLTAANFSCSSSRHLRAEQFMHMVSVVQVLSTMSDFTHTVSFQEPFANSSLLQHPYCYQFVPRECGTHVPWCRAPVHIC